MRGGASALGGAARPRPGAGPSERLGWAGRVLGAGRARARARLLPREADEDAQPAVDAEDSGVRALARAIEARDHVEDDDLDGGEHRERKRENHLA